MERKQNCIYTLSWSHNSTEGLPIDKEFVNEIQNPTKYNPSIYFAIVKHAF